jgi:hypothetical protein
MASIMSKHRFTFIGLAVSVLAASVLVMGQQQTPSSQQSPGGAPPGGGVPGRGPQPPMSFFVTSVGKGDGGNLGGLAGADAHCQTLAAAAGRGSVRWHAYVSTQGPNAVNARDRIGTGPWYNRAGQVIAANVSELQGDTLEQARIGNFLNGANSLDEKGQPVPGTEHDILTGSTLDGRAYTGNSRDYTCNNWTSNAHVEAAPGRVADPPPPNRPSARLGHADKGNFVPSWNSSHPSAGCSQRNFVATGGAGRLYCFAIN